MEKEKNNCIVIAKEMTNLIDVILSVLQHVNNHELRSPICRISGIINLIKLGEQQPQLLELMEISTNELISITEIINRDLYNYREELNEFIENNIMSNPKI